MTHGQRLMAISSGFEAATGLLLLIAPSFLTRLLIGSDIEGAAIIIAAIAGLALISLAIACWPTSERAGLGSYAGLLVYDLLVALLLLETLATSAADGLLLWPAILIHLVLTVLIALALIGARRRPAVRS